MTVVVFYCSNHLDFPTTVQDLSLYSPRFVKVAATARRAAPDRPAR